LWGCCFAATIFLNFGYSKLIASEGQASTQAPQSTQASASTFAFSSTILIASLGHSSTQLSQPVHFSLSILAGICPTLSKELQICQREEMLQDYDDITI